MNRTISGRITILRGIRHQAETYIRRLTELGDWTPYAAVFFLYVFGKTYQNERKRMQEERVQPLKDERRQFERVERQLVREIDVKGASSSRLWRLLPRRVKRAQRG